jgi:carboxymethylenebutenolidase
MMSEVDLGQQAREHGGSQHLRGYLARPQGTGPWPGVVLLHEAFGADDVMRRHADRLAGLGYLAVLPDLFTEGGAVRCISAMLRALSAGHGRAFQDIEVSRQWLLRQDDCTGKVGVIGFCLGGAFAIATAPRFDVAAPNYGFLPKDLDQAVRGACPVVASYGGHDRPLRGAAARLEAALQKAGVPHDVKEYPGAGHCFLNDAPVGPRLIRVLLKATGGGPYPEAAADAWQRVGEFFARHLAGTEPGTSTSAPDAASTQPAAAQRSRSSPAQAESG